MTGIYSNIVEAKDGTLIPVFKSNQTMYSKYYPAKDADFFLKNCKEDEKQFFLICGIGNGLHIKALRNKFPKAKILAFESYQEDLNFLETNFNINQMSKEYLFDICLQEDIPKNIINKYVPIIHGNFSMLQQRAWADNNKENLEKITLSVNQVLEEISADISTQGYFGKIWHRNIIQNLLLAPEINQNPDVLNTKKTEALIVAAGPSLDLAIEKIQSDTYIKNQFIISTDTALPVLYKNNIQPDMVVTIDGQIISRLHFIGKLSKETCIAADLSCCPTIIRQAINQKYPIIFTRSNHPLASIISKYFYDEYKYEITNIYSGSGTVTIAAVD
ncbi:MAG: motility associated factor glycosyltransferase family protein, partial [Spirochaetaceae bacterium]|nr:motility associated factor glycosyltransferase family protein [Spirochaetaceae bacterium]